MSSAAWYWSRTAPAFLAMVGLIPYGREVTGALPWCGNLEGD